MLFSIVLLIVLILINAFFAASEIALISINDNKVRLMANKGDKKAQRLQQLLGEPSQFLATIQIGITLAGFLASAFAADRFAGPLVALIKRTGVGIPEIWLKNIAVILITVLLSYLTLVLGELVPKRIGMKKAEPISMAVVGPLRLLSVITSPFVKLLTLSTDGIVRLLGMDPGEEDEEVTEEEIRMMVDVGEERGAIDVREGEMIDNIFEFNNKTVEEIMTHRMAVAAVPVDADLPEILSIVHREKYTRLPVYDGTIDNVVGLLHTKDLLQHIGPEGLPRDFQLRSILRKPCIVPQSKRTDVLFREMQRHKVHMAVVIDEYGGTAGIVTIEDLMEEIVGNIFDEYDADEIDFEKLDDHTYRVGGSVSLDAVEDYLDVDLPTDTYETLCGFVTGLLDRIPHDGEKPEIAYGGFTFRADKVDGRRITEVIVTKTE